VTTSQLAAEVIRKINKMDRWDYTINAIALVDCPMPEERMEIEGIHVVADADTLVEYCKKALVDEVLFFGDTLKLASMNAVRKISSMGITVHINIDLIDMQIQAADRTITNIADFYTATFANRFLTTRQQIIKRAMDIVGAVIGLILTVPITIIFAPIIYIQSPGPIFFKQKRVGRNGRYFYIYKFRSMYPDAEKRKAALMAENEMDGFMFKMENDPRIFPIGRFMRKTSLDEFPQFWNVLKGDMSLVGTRPPTLDEFSKYKSHHKMRLSARPGLTGLWQVSGRNKIKDFEEVVRLDVEYINQWSVWLDLKIIFKTLGVMVQRKGR
jgi:exopolysaccharide biosynthesis polyprenyl glycosylphosphotransferase